MIETQFSKVIKIFRSNNALEYRWHGNLDLLNQYCSISNTSPKKKKMTNMNENSVTNLTKGLILINFPTLIRD